MPRRLNAIPEGLKQNLQNTSFENQVVTWLMQDGWQVFVPALDNGHKTDVLIAEGRRYFRIQIKTVDANKGKSQEITNVWGEIPIDFIIYFARNGEWGYVVPAFTEKHKTLNAAEHKFFMLKKNEFLTAFHTVDQTL